MLRTNFSTEGIPSEWIFEYYCKLNEKLDGQELKINSIFKEERTPSMCIYIDTDSTYKFKDFSSGFQGDHVELVRRIYKITREHAACRIRDDYKKTGGKIEHVAKRIIHEVPSKFSVSSYTIRNWNTDDAAFWIQFNIGTTLLNKYHVRPIESFVMLRHRKGLVDEIKIKDYNTYGYFTEDGQLYKIYRPRNTSAKFIAIETVIHGLEELSYSKPTLMITSSLKDVMSLDSLDFNAEYIASSSESSMIPKNIILTLGLKYNRIITFFDNDSAGIIALNKYKNQYGIPGITPTFAKDPSDCIKKEGVIKTRKMIIDLIKTL